MLQKIEFTKTIEKNFSYFKQIPLLPNLIDEQLKLLILFIRPVVFSKMTDYVKYVKTIEGLTSKYHRYGGLEFQVNGKEIGHLHGDGLVDLRFNLAIKQQIVQEGLAEPHHVFPDTGWISYTITSDKPIEDLQELTLRAVEFAKRG